MKFTHNNGGEARRRRATPSELPWPTLPLPRRNNQIDSAA